MAATDPHQDARVTPPSSAIGLGKPSGTPPNPISHVLGIDQQQLSDRLAKYKPIDVFMRPALSGGSSAGPGQARSSSNKELEQWQIRLPRFLFRGFASRSGGNPGLNRSRLIQPHAFYGTDRHAESWPGERDGCPATSIDFQKFRQEINEHLFTLTDVQSHFSSWAADFQTALSYAGNPSPVDDSPMIAVLDTALCDPRYTAIHHVPALQAAGISQGSYPHEYLVYGPVVGPAYCCCVPVSSLMRAGLSVHYRLTDKSITGNLDRASKIASLFRHEMYKVAGPALFLTVFAADLSRSTRYTSERYRELDLTWSQEDITTILNYLRPRIYDASLCDYQPLVNPKTYVAGFWQLRCMVQLLISVDKEIQMTRSEWAVQVQPKRDMICPTESTPSCGKRKAESDPSTRPAKRVDIKDEDKSRSGRLARVKGAKSWPDGGSSPVTRSATRAARAAHAANVRRRLQ